MKLQTGAVQGFAQSDFPALTFLRQHSPCFPGFTFDTESIVKRRARKNIFQRGLSTASSSISSAAGTFVSAEKFSDHRFRRNVAAPQKRRVFDFLQTPSMH
jgi:hypothetical protein